MIRIEDRDVYYAIKQFDLGGRRSERLIDKAWALYDAWRTDMDGPFVAAEEFHSQLWGALATGLR